MNLKAPERITYTNGHSFCPGCGHGLAIRLVGEVLEELALEEKTIAVLDVACGGMPIEIWQYDTIEAAHGRPVPTATGVKKVRPEHTVFAYLGDGAAYSIGIAETIHSARRNDNITVIVVNNCVYGMTGGQMSPTTIDGQITSSTIDGKDPKRDGVTLDIIPFLKSLDVAYLARAALADVPGITRAKKYLRKAFEKQMDNQGFSFVELLSPCPTNWNLSPEKAARKIKDDIIPVFPVGEFVERNVISETDREGQ